MTSSPRDDNFVPALIAALDTDGKTVVKVKANPLTNVLQVKNGSTGADKGVGVAVKDENNVPTLLATSSADGVTQVPVFADSNGNILINSN